MVKVIAVTFCVTVAASLAARQGSTTMAAFQVCLQIWLAASLLADGLAVAGQVRFSFIQSSKYLNDIFPYIFPNFATNALHLDVIGFGTS